MDDGISATAAALKGYVEDREGIPPVCQILYWMAADSVAAAGVEAVCGGGNPGDNSSVKATTEKAAKK